VGPYFTYGTTAVIKPLKRSMGRLGFEVTTLGLGGQASLQWTPADVDPTKIILKAFSLGINYFDTSNNYGPSQLNVGKAFRELHLIPGQPGYRESLRRSIFLTSKTGMRWAKGGWMKENLHNFGNGPKGSKTVDDLKRTMTQVFGDGKGYYPPGAYLNMVLAHGVGSMEDVEALYEGLDNTDPRAENIGALAALRDYRDGSNLTGLNPKHEKLIRHIGFSGHYSPVVMMEMIQRDQAGLLEGMLVAMNANDRLNFNMQYNVIPVAAAKNMGLIAMKVFADGAMYTKEPAWTRSPENVVRTVGSDTLSSRSLVEYSLTTPGIHTAIIGTGQIDLDPKLCQLQQNLSAAQIMPNGLSVSDRRDIEKITSTVKDGKTNYFQEPFQALSAPREASAHLEICEGRRVVRLEWQTAYAGAEPIARYEIWRDEKRIAQVPYQPQLSKKPFVFEDELIDKAAHTYQLKTVDTISRVAATEGLPIPGVA
jgi:aryl-alcohol dehydrogenase-like predicted oxidoreductase